MASRYRRLKKLNKMQKLKPIRMWIDGNIYAIPSNRKDRNSDHKGINTDKSRYLNFNITNDDGKYSTKFLLPQPYYNYLRTKFNVKEFQTETNTELDIGNENNKGIFIKGNSFDLVAKAREEMHIICNEIRNSYRPFQFISIPMLSAEIKDNFMKFKDGLLNASEHISGMEEKIFQKSDKLHITIVVFTLLDESEIKEASKILAQCKDEYLDPFVKENGPIRLKLKGVHCFKDENIRKAKVVFTKAEHDNPEVFQTLLDKIANKFYESGLLKNFVDSVVVHVTLINVKLRNSRSERFKNKPKPIDATYILENYKAYEFGSCNFDSIHLSLMSVTGDDGFYKPIAKVLF